MTDAWEALHVAPVPITYIPLTFHWCIGMLGAQVKVKIEGKGKRGGGQMGIFYILNFSKFSQWSNMFTKEIYKPTAATNVLALLSDKNCNMTV